MEDGLRPLATKRAFVDSFEDLPGRDKRQFLGSPGQHGAAANGSSMEVVYRILCQQNRTGSVIGKGGSIIKALREETGARIKIADAVPGVDERVIIVSGHEQATVGWSAAQEGLLQVHSRIIAPPQGEEGVPVGPVVTARMLVPSTQIGCLLGKGGSIISQMREETGAAIRVMPKEQLPGCALQTDELVQVMGDLPVVQKALEDISSRLRANPVRALSTRPPKALESSQGLESPSAAFRDTLGGAAALPYGLHVTSAAVASGELVEVVYRILCPSSKTGAVIGRGGTIIRQIRDETGARLKISEAIPDVDERVVIISNSEILASPESAAQEALFRVHSALVEPEASEPGAIVTTRMLVQSTQIGCLLGRGGSIITEMRRTTRANIRILGRDELPGCALDSDELVQIVGDILAVRQALHEVSARLRANPPRDRHVAGPPTPRTHVVESSQVYPVAQTQTGAVTAPTTLPAAEAPAGLPAAASLSILNVPIPLDAVGSIIGKGGANIAQIRNISGARVKLHDLVDGALERVVELAGTPEQLQAAQALLHAFIVSGAANLGGGSTNY